MTRKRTWFLAAVLIILALPSFAGLSKYKDWPNSPEGYFMTHAERYQWSKLDSDTDAEKFIADFVAKRPANFEKEVADRAANADKYLTVGNTRGSKSLRGKVIILLGVPTAMDSSEQTVTSSSKRDNPIVASAMSNFNAPGGAENMSDGTVVKEMSTQNSIRIMHFNYQGAVARTADRKAIDIYVEVQSATGKDRAASGSQAADLDSIFELVAQSWIKK
jgi:GWxTD domain-containing protein